MSFSKGYHLQLTFCDKMCSLPELMDWFDKETFRQKQ